MNRATMALFAVIALTCPAPAAAQATDDEGRRWWQHVTVLADDRMEGRETGSRGYKRAAEYVVKRLKQAGVSPAGSNGFYQPVKLLRRTLDERRSSVALVREGQESRVTLGEEAYFSTRADLAPRLEAPLVFAGYGIRVPERDHDDFAGLDVKGKIVVLISGAPAEIPTELASHYQSTGERWKALRAAGAIGTIMIPNPAAMDIPWARQMVTRLQPSMRLADPRFNETEGWQLSLVWNPQHADKLLAGSGRAAAELFALAKERKPLPRFALPVSLRARTHVTESAVESFNVVGKLEGSDPQLRGEHVALSAHLDHVGVGAPVANDPLRDGVYNGAMDNASGVAMLLEVARALREGAQPHRRSLLFVFVTAEEKGLLGSRYFARQPTVGKGSIVANVNIDMFLPIVAAKGLIVRGMTESDLGDLARKAVEGTGLRALPDPEPQRNAFIRSDQYSFIREGVPAVSMSIGYEKGSPEEAVVQRWRRERYHAPSDDLAQPVDRAAAVAYKRVVSALLLAAANAEERPQWKPASFFRRFAAAAGAR